MKATHTNLTLPLADKHGNYYFGVKDGKPWLPAIFPHKKIQNQLVVYTGTYTVLIGPGDGFICSGNGERIHFKTVQLAFQALKAELDRIRGK